MAEQSEAEDKIREKVKHVKHKEKTSSDLPEKHEKVKEKHDNTYHAQSNSVIKSDAEETIKIKKVTLWQGISAVLGVLLVLSIYTGGLGFGETESTSSSSTTGGSAPPPPSGEPPPAAEVKIGQAPVKGEENAPVTIIEFSDFQCPFCSRFYSQTLSQIEEEYVKTGKVKFAYKHFPLESIHPQALPAALASECAKEQNKFWEFHDLAFENTQSLGDATYKQWAGQIGLDTEQFNECLDSRKYESSVRNDLQEGSSAGIRGTPGFLLNGQVISGAQPFQVFQQAIEAALQS